MVQTPASLQALTQLEQARIRPMPQRDADQTLGMLSRIQSVATSLMCDITEMLAATNTETDPAESAAARSASTDPGIQADGQDGQTTLGHAQGQGTVRHR